MLTEVINTTRQVAAQIASAPAASAGIATTQADVARLSGGVLDKIVQAQQSALSFAGQALGQLDQVLQPGATPDAAVAVLAALRQQALTEQAMVADTAKAAADVVTSLGNDAATLTTEATGMQDAVAGLNAQRAQASSDAASIANRIKWINAFSWFPPVKLADELASLITSQKTTEQTLSDAENRLRDVEQRQAALTAVIQQTRSVCTGAGQLANATQSLANTVNLVAGELGEDGLSGSGAALAILHAAALRANIQALQSLAS